MKILQLSKSQLREFIAPTIKAQESYPLDSIDPELVSSNWEVFLDSGGGKAFGAEVDGAPAGFLLSLYSMDLLCGKRKAFEYLWMVSPAHRSSGAAIALFKEFEKDAAESGYYSVVCGCHSFAKRCGAMRRLYRKLGYSPISEAFSKTL